MVDHLLKRRAAWPARLFYPDHGLGKARTRVLLGLARSGRHWRSRHLSLPYAGSFENNRNLWNGFFTEVLDLRILLLQFRQGSAHILLEAFISAWAVCNGSAHPM